MKSLPTLGRELIGALVVVFAAAIVVAGTGILLLYPHLRTPAQATVYLGVLAAADILIFAAFVHVVVRLRVVRPLERLVAEVEEIAGGDISRRIEVGETQEMVRLAESVNRMAGRLIVHQEELKANVRSLDRTNRELTEARDELIRVEKMASVGRLGAGIAHEIGNPLGAILGYLGLLGRGADERRKELVAAAEKEAHRIDRIVHGLLDYARPREARVRPIDVNEVVNQTVELLRVQGRLSAVDISTDLATALPAVLGDWNQLQQILVNLMINALDALDGVPQPALAVTTRFEAFPLVRPFPARRRDDPPDIDYSHRRRFNQRPQIPRRTPFAGGDEVVHISVRDNGPGISPEHREQIFEPFFTTKEPGRGTGLGLAVAARLIDAMGGTIRVVATVGGGTTFTILLPKAKPDREGAHA